MSVIRDGDFKDVGADPVQLSGVVDYLNMVPGSKFAVLINEDRRSNVKGSFRTKNDNVDLSRVAAVFGGGGHPKASGFSIPGKLEGEVRYTIVADDMSKKSLEF
jgi:phosphoesterase RecJ-like protein